ncbi:hypothetical protein AF332_08490 [Sporosarcina globispora]|uniref:Uncharacterized protein n=1 Tax=Sporosarcina globispora TaxID=1459 RepID=A0A0M0GBD5_SPOGL|nr:hypothetical protein AF332_08490 [Sporosarcina globispora]
MTGHSQRAGDAENRQCPHKMNSPLSAVLKKDRLGAAGCSTPVIKTNSILLFMSARIKSVNQGGTVEQVIKAFSSLIPTIDRCL